VSKSVHYIIASEATDMNAEHIYAPDQPTAVEKYVDGENQYGYDRSNFDGYEVYVVPASLVTAWLVELYDPPPQEQEIRILKTGKGI
jgi:hypothetical protein